MAETTTRFPIANLPTALSLDDAVGVAYREDLDYIEERLRGRLSVLVECDKQLSLYLFKQLRQRLKQSRDGQTYQFVVIDGRPRNNQSGPAAAQAPESAAPRGSAGMGGPQASDGSAALAGAATNNGGTQTEDGVGEKPRGILQTTLTNLQQQVFNFDTSKILCVPHLDLVTTVTRSGLTIETRETAALLYENPNLTLLAFKDPSFELPKVIESVFPFRRQVAGVPRDRLTQLVLAGEARKFGVETFNPYQLYTYTSGLNVVRFRQVMQHFMRERDFDPNMPDGERARMQTLRGLTATSDFELPDTRLERDIAGYSSVKKRLRQDILDLVHAKDQLENPAEIKAIEELIPRGIILEGPPGTGKTLFAKGLATELNATVIVVSGPEIKSKWLGETEANLRRIFAQARRAAPSVIVFDEIDSIAPARDRGMVHEASHSTVNQMLTEMDGFRADELVFVVGTTNYAASLDQALLRPGRFELKVLVDNPHDVDREAIIKLYRSKLSLPMTDEQVDNLMRRTRGMADRRAGHRFTGDHLYSIMKAVKREHLRTHPGKPEEPVSSKMIDKVMRTFLGERKAPNQDEMRVIAVHEAGHAVLQELLPDSPPTEKVTVDADEGESDFSQFFTKSEDPLNAFVQTEAEIRSVICVMFGGRIAERLVFGSVSGGAAMDFDMASKAARAMVMVHGMSPADPAEAPTDGPLAGMGYSVPMLLRSFWHQLENRDAFPVSPELQARIDRAIDQILTEEYERAFRIVSEHRELLTTIGDRLLEKKELARDDFKDLLPEAANQKAVTWKERRERLDAARKQEEAEEDDAEPDDSAAAATPSGDSVPSGSA